MIELLSPEAPARAGSPLAAPAVTIDPKQLDIATVRSRTSRGSQIVTVVALVVPPLGLVAAGAALWGVAFHLRDLLLLIGFYVATGLGITVGYHRLFTHRSFETNQTVRVILAVLGAMTLQGPLTQWVTDHRKHHARSDADGDPHSPHLAGAGVFGAIRGLWHAHLGWMFSTKGLERGATYGADLYGDRAIRIVDRCYLLWVALSLGLPFAFGYVLTGRAAGGVEALVWAGLVRIFAFEHATFAVNSACHYFGARRYEVSDKSRNNRVVALLTFGEGWHNNHHAFPRSARHGLRRTEIDVSWIVIRSLAACRLAKRVSLPTPAQQLRVARVAR